jgi:hypothetical protein
MAFSILVDRESLRSIAQYSDVIAIPENYISELYLRHNEVAVTKTHSESVLNLRLNVVAFTQNPSCICDRV